MKKEKLKKVLGSMGIVMCLSTMLIGCSSEMDEVGNATSKGIQSDFKTFIEIDPELIESGLLYTNGQELDRYMEALLRFDANVVIENNLLRYNGGTSDELNISEFLFNLFMNKIEKTNKNIQIGYLVVVDGELYTSASLNNEKHIMRIKSRSTEVCWNRYTPGNLDGNEQEVGQTILDGMRHFNHVTSNGGPSGKIGDYVNLLSYDDWSQGNASISGQFTFNNSNCVYSLSNPNAGMGNNATGFNGLSSIDYDVNEEYGVYKIFINENKFQTPVMTITTRDYETYQELKRYIGPEE